MRLGRSPLIRALNRLVPNVILSVVGLVGWTVQLARDPRSFVRYLGLLLVPRTPVEVSLRGLEHPIFLRPATTDARVAYGALGMAYHLPPIELREDATIVDLGANIGLTAADYASRYPAATVIAVEMDDRNAALARRNTAVYGDRVAVIHAAAWSEATRLSYVAPEGDEWGFAVSERGDHPWIFSRWTLRALNAKCSRRTPLGHRGFGRFRLRSMGRTPSSSASETCRTSALLPNGIRSTAPL